MNQTTILKRFSLLIPLVLLLLPTLTFAATNNGEGDILHLALTDPSRIFLGQLFGSVGSVLHGTGSTMFGTLFRYFNLGILAIASIFMLWTTVKLIISTSSEGSFMGRGGQGAYHVLRTVSGIGLMVPTAAGYSVIQMIVMFFVLQGAGLANSVWNKMLGAFEKGDQLMTAPEADLASITDLTGTILEAQVCMYYHEKLEWDLYDDARKSISQSPNNPRAKSFPSFVPSFDKDSKTVNFPSNRGNSRTDAGCGQISWAQVKATNNDQVELALRTVIQTLAPAARNIANPRPGDLSIVDSKDNTTLLDRHVQTVVVGANADWSNLTIPVRTANDKQSLSSDFYKNARDSGWVYAGSYYYELCKVQRDLVAATEVKLKITKPIMCLSGTKTGDYIKFPEIGQDPDCMKNVNNNYANSKSQPNLGKVYTDAAAYITHAKVLAAKVQQANTNVLIPRIESQDAGMASGLLSPVSSGLDRTLGFFAQEGGDPILKLQNMGNTLMGIIVVVWIVGSIIIFALSAGVSIMSSVNSFGFALSNAIAIIIPLLMALVSILFVQGAIIAVYVPLIPFIVFTFSVLGWFIAVIEAMAAAPLVALGITHPEGQGLLGKSEQAIMLLLGVFLRPVLMIMGLFGGMLLSRIMLSILNAAFIKAVSASIGVWGFVATFMIYVVLVMQIVTQSYSLIYHIPDRILRWLGVSGDQSMVGEVLRAAEEKQRTMAESGARVGTGMVEGWKGTGDRVRQAKDSDQASDQGRHWMPVGQRGKPRVTGGGS